MLAMLEVNGETTEASAWDSEMPTSAAFRAPQSLAPSPHMPTQYLCRVGARLEPVRRLRGCETTPGLPWACRRAWGWLVPAAHLVPRTAWCPGRRRCSVNRGHECVWLDGPRRACWGSLCG